MSASPHTRGWTPPAAEEPEPPAGFPAHAGMDPPRPRAHGRPTRLPRTRGDGPTPSNPNARGSRASPHTRGWTPVGAAAADRLRGFPAHAGMDREARRGPRRAAGFPAHAGMDPRTARDRRGCTRLPRTRGDGPLPPLPALPDWRASPHTRGWTPRTAGADGEDGGFPAHAGMDLDDPAVQVANDRLPRTRGDGPVRPWYPFEGRSASPHTRGWTRQVPLEGVHARGFPAHAGMDPGHPGGLRRWWRLPRTRGDGPRLSDGTLIPQRASPHTRGWTLAGRVGSAAHRGFPAHAGMDPS